IDVSPGGQGRLLVRRILLSSSSVKCQPPKYPFGRWAFSAGDEASDLQAAAYGANGCGSTEAVCTVPEPAAGASGSADRVVPSTSRSDADVPFCSFSRAESPGAL